MTQAAALPLSGIRVLDASHVLSGPFATYQLALLGADVIRVERVAGDDFVRYHGGTDAMKSHGLGASFLSQNACKRSIAINLKDKRGLEVFLCLAQNADVLMENFRPGVVDRLGVGFDAVSALNSKIIYCSLTGYGPTGPLAKAPAYDHILQGISGMMAMTGTPDSGPMRVGFPIVDYIAGQTAAFAILSALMHRQRHGGAAQHLQVPMLDSLVALMSAYAIDHETTGSLRGLEGNQAFSNSPFSDRFDTAEGQIVVTANTPAQAERLCETIGRPDLKPLNQQAASGKELSADQRSEIATALRDSFAAASAEEWERRLMSASVPAAKVRTLAEILDHPQLAEGGLMRELPVPEADRSVHVPGLAFRADGWPARDLEPAPTLGRDTDAVLTQAGYAQSEIAELRASGVIA